MAEVVAPVEVPEVPVPEVVVAPVVVAAPVARESEWEEVPNDDAKPELHRSQLDPEILRQQGANRRRDEELRDRERREAALAAKRVVVERPGKVAPAAIAAVPPTEAEAKEKAKKDALRPHVRKRPEDEVEDDRPKKKGAKERKTTTAVTFEPRNVSRAHLHVEDFVGEESDEEQLRRRKKKSLKMPEDTKRHAFEKPTEKIVREIAIPSTITVGELSARMAVKAGTVIKELMKLGVMATINDALDQATAQIVVTELGHGVAFGQRRCSRRSIGRIVGGTWRYRRAARAGCHCHGARRPR